MKVILCTSQEMEKRIWHIMSKEGALTEFCDL